MGKVQCIINGADNLASITLYSDGVPLDMPAAGVTRVVIAVDDEAGTVIDSDVITMDWTTLVPIDGQNAYPITFRGDDAGLTAGVYRDCEMRIYDNQNPVGIVWPDLLTLVVQ